MSGTWMCESILLQCQPTRVRVIASLVDPRDEAVMHTQLERDFRPADRAALWAYLDQLLPR